MNRTVFSIATGRRAPLDNERGTALILTLSMLAIMSILGALALTTTTSEIGISGNFRAGQQAFFAAERAVEYAMTNEVIFDRAVTAFPVDLTDNDESNDTTHEATVAVGTGVGRSGLRDGETNQVDYLTSGSLPPGSGSDPSYFQARYYVITVNGEGPNNSTARVESQVARIVPK